ncbi:hypothetical protein [Mycobacterium sp.]|uniref:hypothetical protein n=1 Tax=Mycobacterium sp. TaxID=1785 RepID=UPI002F3E407D
MAGPWVAGPSASGMGSAGGAGAGSSTMGMFAGAAAEAIPAGPTSMAPASTPALTRPTVKARADRIQHNVAISPG